MPFISTREKIKLSKGEKTKLEAISKSRTESKSKIERAAMLLLYSEDNTISSIARKLHTNRPRVELQCCFFILKIIQYLLSPENFIQIARE